MSIMRFCATEEFYALKDCHKGSFSQDLLKVSGSINFFKVQIPSIGLINYTQGNKSNNNSDNANH